MNFEIIIDDAFSVLNCDSEFEPIGSEKVLSIVNDFENGEWRFENFESFIWNNLKETALNYKERESLITAGEYTVLTKAAKNLRLDEKTNGKGSEIAEIVLYGIMKRHYKALPVVPKIFYKQNRNDEAKGADSIHIVIEDEDNFSLWFGESKFYSSIENARLSTIVDSVKESIDIEKIKKENSIITSLSDIDDCPDIDDDLKNKIKKKLSLEKSIDEIKPILNIPILLLHECKKTKEQTVFSKKYIEEIKSYHKDRATEYFKKQIEKCGSVHLYEKINFHLILFPVPNKSKIVNKFITQAKNFRN